MESIYVPCIYYSINNREKFFLNMRESIIKILSSDRIYGKNIKIMLWENLQIVLWKNREADIVLNRIRNEINKHSG